MTASVKEFGKAWWSEVYNRVIGAAVFLDDASAECLHWDGGLFNLLSAGAVSVKALSSFEFSRKEHKKAVFITQTTSNELRSIREIIRNSDFSHCNLISCVSLDTVYSELNEGRDVSDVIAAGKGATEATKQLEGMLIDWIGKEQCAVEVIHIPIFTISPTSVIFLTPPHHDIYPTFDGQLTPDAKTSLDLYSLDPRERSQVRRLASSLNSMLDSMNLKEDVFYMGAFSSLVAGILENSPVCLNRRKNCSNGCSVILVDRTLDLCGVTSHGSESMLDKAMAVLPPFPGHCNDVAVDMAPLCEARVISGDYLQVSPGCLYHANDTACTQTYDHMINKSQKEVMFDLYNKLSQIDVHKSPGLKTLTRVTSQSVEKIVSATKGNYAVISQHLGTLQQALGVVQTLKAPLRSQLELLANLESQTSQSLAASKDSTSVLHQITQLIKSRKERRLPLPNLLALIVHVYSLNGTDVTFPKTHEDGLAEALSVAMHEDAPSSPRAHEPPATDALAPLAIVGRLKQIALMRNGLHKYKTLLRPCETGTGHEYRGALQQLVDDMVDTDRPEIPDLRHRSDGIKDLLFTSFNILTSKKKGRSTKHPLDNQTVILFVIGGTTAEECKRLHRSVITSGVDNTLLIGSTKFVAPTQAMKDVLLRPRLVSCCAMTAVLACIVATVTLMLGVGIGLGYHYCIVQGKTYKLGLREYMRRYPESANNSKNDYSRSERNIKLGDGESAMGLDSLLSMDFPMQSTMTVPLQADLSSLLAKLKAMNKNFTLHLVAT